MQTISKYSDAYNQNINRTQADDDEKQKMLGKNNNLLHRIFRRHISVVFRPVCSHSHGHKHFSSVLKLTAAKRNICTC